MSGASIHDSRKHPICPPFYGESGPAYTRVFRTDFVANLWSEVDEAGHSLAEHPPAPLWDLKSEICRLADLARLV